MDTSLLTANNDTERAQLIWDAVTGFQPLEEFMELSGTDDAQEAIDAYCADWPFEETSPDDEVAGLTYREWMKAYAETQLAGDELPSP